MGTSPRSAIAGPFNTTSQTAPGLVRTLVCNAVSNRATLSWSAPSDTGGVLATQLTYYVFGIAASGDVATSTPSNQNVTDFSGVCAVFASPRVCFCLLLEVSRACCSQEHRVYPK